MQYIMPRPGDRGRRRRMTQEFAMEQNIATARVSVARPNWGQ